MQGACVGFELLVQELKGHRVEHAHPGGATSLQSHCEELVPLGGIYDPVRHALQDLAFVLPILHG